MDDKLKFQALEWERGEPLAVTLDLEAAHFVGEFRDRDPGKALGRLRWELLGHIEVDETFDDTVEVDFSFDRATRTRVGLGRRPMSGYLRVERTHESLLGRKSFHATLRFEVMGGLDLSQPVARPTYRACFLRRPGTHTLAIDFGTTASCIALKRISGYEDPQLQKLDAGGEPTLYPSSIWFMDGQPPEQRRNVQPVPLGEPVRFCGFGRTNLRIATVDNPGQVVPSLKRMIGVRSTYWRNFGITAEEDQLAVPGRLLWSFLQNLFQCMVKRNRRIWAKDPPMVENVVVTVPNKAGHQFIEPLTSAICTAANTCLDGSPLTEGWEIEEKNISILRESEAAVAEFVFRNPYEGGLLGQVGSGETALVAVFDMGAGTCDSALVEYLRSADGDAGDVTARMNLIARTGLQIGGDTLDEIIARLVFDKLRGQPLDLGAGVYELLLGLEKPARDDGKSLIADLKDELQAEDIDFFGSYRSLADLLEDGPDRLHELQSLRAAFKYLAQDMKIAIAETFYGRGASETYHIEFPDGVSADDNLRLQQRIVETAEDDQLLTDQKVGEISGLLDVLRGHFERCEVIYVPSRIGPHLKMKEPLRFPLKSLLIRGDFKTFIEKIEAEFVDELLEDPPSVSGALHVVFTGRLLAFPMIQELLILNLTKRPELPRLRFPNQGYGPLKLKQAVASGAILAKDQGLNFNQLSARVLSNYCLLHFDQETGGPRLARLVAQGAEYDSLGVARGSTAEMQGLEQRGVYLRPAPDTQDILMIFEIDRLNWDDPAAVKDFAMAYKYKMHKISVVLNCLIKREGELEKNGRRRVEIAVRRDGRARARVFPGTTSDGQPTGRALELSNTGEDSDPTLNEGDVWAAFPL